MSNDHPGYVPPASMHLKHFLGLVDHGILFLQNYLWVDIHSDNDFQASLAVGKMILNAATYDHTIMVRLAEQGIEVNNLASHPYPPLIFFLKKFGRPSLMSVRAWNILILAALLHSPDSQITTVYGLLSSVSFAHHAALRVYIQSATAPPETAMTDINHAYISIKLWLLLAQKKALNDTAGDTAALVAWSELWPPFENLMNAFEQDARAGQSQVRLYK